MIRHYNKDTTPYLCSCCEAPGTVGIRWQTVDEIVVSMGQESLPIKAYKQHAIEFCDSCYRRMTIESFVRMLEATKKVDE